MPRQKRYLSIVGGAAPHFCHPPVCQAHLPIEIPIFPSHPRLIPSRGRYPLTRPGYVQPVDALHAHFARRGWRPFAFQEAVWAAYSAGQSGLVHASTGTGKTLAAWGGMLIEESQLRLAMTQPAAPMRSQTGPAGNARKSKATRLTRGIPKAPSSDPAPANCSQHEANSVQAAGMPAVAPAPLLPGASAPGLRYLWLTPMRALAADTHKSLTEAAIAIGLMQDEQDHRFRIELRTGDTTSAVKLKQRELPPHALITTPESLSVMLSYPQMQPHFAGLRGIVVDEWHELMGSKRGVQTELCLAHLRACSPAARTWGLSATLGNTTEALDALLGNSAARRSAVLVKGEAGKLYNFEVLIPESIERFPWAGHLGIRMLQPVLQRIERAVTTLVFTNTRSQSEIWFQSILRARPDLIGQVAIHHGSLDRDLRSRVEDLTKRGKLRAVVCTSSLDLGVDFPPVDQVVQIGSPKGIARLMQRAGRSGHQPGRTSTVLCVPTSALELVEFAAARDAMERKAIEARTPLRLSLDVLCQHILTLACGAGPQGLDADALRDEVRSTYAFAEMTDLHWQWAIEFAAQGGKALTAYGRFARLIEKVNQDTGELRYTVANQPLVKLHRLGIGTITSDPSINIALRSGKVLGSIEEGFISKLQPGDVFVFSGKRLRFVRIQQLTATVDPAQHLKSGRVPSWAGTRMPLSHELAEAVKVKLAQADAQSFIGPEMQAVRPLLELQRQWSALPKPGELVIERLRSAEGYHAFVYPLAGRLVHEGLVALTAYRIAQRKPHTFSMSANDYGFELLSATPFELDADAWRALLSVDCLAEDLLGCVNQAELARRQFREIARIAGLIVPSYPGQARSGQARSGRQLQASSELFFDVFTEFDPSNMLLGQARREVLERQLEFARTLRTLESIAAMKLTIVAVAKLTPFAFPLWVDRLRQQLTSEKHEDRIQRMLSHLEAAAANPAASAQAEPDFSDPQHELEAPPVRNRRGRSPDKQAKVKVPWRRPRL